MRITFLTHFPGRGGSTILLQQLRDFFVQRGHSVEIVSGTDDPAPLLRDYHVVAEAGNTWRQRRRAYLDCIQRTAPDLVYVISGSEEFDLLRFLPLPRVHHISSLERHPWMDIPRLVESSAAYTEMFTANTPDVLEFISPLLFGSGAISALAPYRLDPSWFSHSGRQAARKDRVIRVCYCSRLEAQQKRAHWLARIIPLARRRGLSLEWHIVGTGPCEAFLRQKVPKSGASVTFHGWLSPDQIRSIYAEMDIFFLCSRWEGLPIAMVEAMLNGLACVVPRIPSGIVHLLEDERAGWMFNANSPAACVAALERACSDRGMLRQKQLCAAAIAEQTYAPAKVETDLLYLEKIIEQLRFNGRVLNPDRTARLRRVSLPAYLSRIPARFLDPSR